MIPPVPQEAIDVQASMESPADAVRLGSSERKVSVPLRETEVTGPQKSVSPDAAMCEETRLRVCLGATCTDRVPHGELSLFEARGTSCITSINMPRVDDWTRDFSGYRAGYDSSDRSA